MENKNIELITTEKFGTIDCNFYQIDEDFYMTREQIGRALEYKEPHKSISKIHERKAQRLDDFSVVVNLTATDGKQYDTTLYNRKGIMEICRYSNQPKANAFIDFIWDVMDKLFKGEAVLLNSSHYAQTLESVKELRSTFLEWISVEKQKLNRIEKSLSFLNYYQRRQILAHRDTKWMLLAKRKFKAISKHLSAEERHVLKGIYVEMEDRFHIDMEEYQADYNFANGLCQSSCLDIIDNNPALRQMFDAVVDDLISRYGLEIDLTLPKRKTLFD